MPKGGKREGAGRKPGAVEDNVKDAIKRALDQSGPTTLDEIWASIIAKARTGSDKHQNIFLNYFYGKPKENLEQPTEMIIRVERNR